MHNKLFQLIIFSFFFKFFSHIGYHRPSVFWLEHFSPLTFKVITDRYVLSDILFFYFFVFLPLLGLFPAAYGGSQARGLSELWPPAYTRATATWDPSCVCNQHHNSHQCQIFNQQSKARDQTHNLTVPSWIH